MEDDYIQQALIGNTDALRYFIKTYRDMAYTIAMSILRDEHSAEETVHDAFVKAFKGLAKFNRSSKFSTWFYRIVVNEALQRAKKRRREKIILIASYDAEPVDEELILSLEARDRRIMINDALRRLPPDESLVLRLFYLEESSIKEVQTITGWSTSKIKVCLHRARKHLLIVLNKINNEIDNHGISGKE